MLRLSNLVSEWWWDLTIRFWFWIGMRIIGFNYADLYVPKRCGNDDDPQLMGVTFTNSEEYAVAVSELEPIERHWKHPHMKELN